MKKLIYSLTLGVAVVMTSCGAEESKQEEENKETTENHETAEEEVSEEPEQVVINGMNFYGLEQFELEMGATVDSMCNIVMTDGEFQGVIHGEVVEVCQKAGCWTKLKKEDGETVMVFYKDHFGIPTDTKPGIDLLLNGVGSIDTLSIDFQKHLLDDAKEDGQEVSQAEYDAITEEKYEVVFEASGVLVPITD